MDDEFITKEMLLKVLLENTELEEDEANKILHYFMAKGIYWLMNEFFLYVINEEGETAFCSLALELDE